MTALKGGRVDRLTAARRHSLLPLPERDRLADRCPDDCYPAKRVEELVFLTSLCAHGSLVIVSAATSLSEEVRTRRAAQENLVASSSELRLWFPSGVLCGWDCGREAPKSLACIGWDREAAVMLGRVEDCTCNETRAGQPQAVLM